MASVHGDLVGAKNFYQNYFVSAALVAGQLVEIEDTTSDTGEIGDPTTTSLVDGLGVASEAVVQDTTPETYEPGSFSRFSLENVAKIAVQPFQIIRLQIFGGAAATALATASPANVLTNTAADSSAPYGLITAAAVGTIDMTGGLVKGRTGNNAGAIRKLTAHSNNTSCTVGMGFLNSIAANDTFIRVPYSRAVGNIQLSTNLVNADGVIATGTGCVMRVVNVKIDEALDLAWVDAIISDHFYNPESV